jgi:hypothetical protein
MVMGFSDEMPGKNLLFPMIERINRFVFTFADHVVNLKYVASEIRENL